MIVSMALGQPYGCCIVSKIKLREVLVISFPGKQEQYMAENQGAVSIRKTVLPGMAIPMLKIRRPNGRLIFNMEITIRR